MRLGQLARKLSLRPAQIVEFLAKNDVQIDENSNYRLEDRHAEMIARHFAPESVQEIITEADEILPEEIQASKPEVFEDQSAEETEVIRVQKIELSGLKVLGKIDLPEPKKKLIAEQEEGDEIINSENPSVKPTAKPRIPNKKSGHNREKQQPRPWKNPLELQREREAREAKEKRRIETEREKEKRKRHYEERVKSMAPIKRKPIKQQPVEKSRPVDTRPVPKSWLGKFLRWWTT